MKGQPDMWLLHEDTARAMRLAEESGFKASDEYVARAKESAQAGPDSFPPNARLAGDTLEIDVVGVLTKHLPGPGHLPQDHE